MFHLLRSGTCARCHHRVQVSYVIDGRRVTVAGAWSGRCPVCKNRIELAGREPVSSVSHPETASPSPYNSRGTSSRGELNGCFSAGGGVSF